MLQARMKNSFHLPEIICASNTISSGSKFKITPEGRLLKRARGAIRTGISGHCLSRLCAGCFARRRLREASPCFPPRPRAPSRHCPPRDIPRCSPYCPSCGTSTRSSYGISAARSLAGSARDAQHSDFRRWAHWRHSGRKTVPATWNGWPEESWPRPRDARSSRGLSSSHRPLRRRTTVGCNQNFRYPRFIHLSAKYKSNEINRWEFSFYNKKFPIFHIWNWFWNYWVRFRSCPTLCRFVLIPHESYRELNLKKNELLIYNELKIRNVWN